MKLHFPHLRYEHKQTNSTESRALFLPQRWLLLTDTGLIEVKYVQIMLAQNPMAEMALWIKRGPEASPLSIWHPSKAL